MRAYNDKPEGAFADQAQSYAGTGTLRYSW